MRLTHNINELEHWLTLALSRLSTAEQRKLQRNIARYLQKRTQQTMKAQTDPEGNPWQARKARKGLSDEEFQALRAGKKPKAKAKPKAMMKGLVKAKKLSIRLAAEEMKIGWFAPRDAMIAQKHHFGATEKLDFGTAVYPARPLLGITEQDKAEIKALIQQAIFGD